MYPLIKTPSLHRYMLEKIFSKLDKLPFIAGISHVFFSNYGDTCAIVIFVYHYITFS